MNKMLNYLNGYKRECVLAPLFKMLEASFDLFVPLVMADIVNVGIAAHDFHYILMRCGILLLLAIIGLACSLTAQYFSAKASVGYSTALRHALFAHIQTLSFTEMDTLGTSTLITRMTSDLNQVQSGLNLFLRLFLRSPFVVFGAMIMAFTVNVRAALETAQAAEFVHSKPLGLDEPVEQGGRNLSGGQKQRLTIARALVSKPEILILDDSASALDYATDAALRKALAALPGSMTVFIVSQRAASLQHADQILVLDDGHLVGLGTHAELLASCPVYEEIYASQFKKGDTRQ